MKTVESSTVIYADDLQVGQIFSLGSWTFSTEEIMAFGRLWDPLPIHVDTRAAAASRFGELVASGIHVVAVMQRLTTDAVYRRSSLVAGRGIQKAWLTSPVRAGVTLHGEVGVQDVRLRVHKNAVVSLLGTFRDAEGNKVFEMVVESVWRTRPS
ncbi:MaoC/PaaZ C-terminal domain-containing protein [Mycobacterium heidelbergense]|uniref:MaoC/PaaZ C-terminal domain-containing protein n=1 Tax=Mycobacterium heidelbergense TaxID=53376 RepID=UPI003CEE87C2